MFEAHFANATVNYYEVKTPSRPRLYYIKHDYEIGGYFREPRNAPEVHFLDHYTKLTEAWQRFWFGLNSPVGFTSEQLKRAWRGYTNSKAFITDYKGTDLFHDYISHENISEPDPSYKCLFCGGNVVTGDEVFENGEHWLYPEYLDTSLSPPDITYETHPWFIHHATNIANDLDDGTRQVNPFTQLGGRLTGVPILYYFGGNKAKQVRYKLKYLRELAPDEPIPSPYNPPL